MYSLVTACMNRESHLRQNLPRWLALPRVAEVVIVDWSNNRPLAELCNVDPRVRVIRVEDEPRWILSYAYNVGIEHVSQPFILKSDADCAPAATITDLQPGERHFHAGFWKTGAAVGKPSVNGQCIFSKAQFTAVNGYSELIRTYGRDDEDFYDRLIAAGFERREIPPSLLDFVDHSNEARTVNQFADEPVLTLEQRITRETSYNEMRNLWIARQLPWTSSSSRATYTEMHREGKYVVLRRNKAQEIAVPSQILSDAHVFALRRVVAALVSLSEPALAKLDAKACLALIGPRLPRAVAKPHGGQERAAIVR